MPKPKHISVKYAEQVLSGKILACRWVKLACQRHLDDLKVGHKRGLYFDEEAADYAMEFFGHLRLWKGREWKGSPFTLAPHFQFILSNIMGWMRADGMRRFRTAYISMARKGAKSSFAAGLGAYFFIVDGEDGAEIYTAAVKEKQAKIVWLHMQNLTKKSIWAEDIEYLKQNMNIKSTDSKCEFVVGDPKGLDGLDTHFASLDELHAHPDAEVHNLLVDSTGTRPQPLILIITTAGFDQTGICYERRDYLTKILKGYKNDFNDDSFFGIIYTLDTKKDWPELKTPLEYRDNPTGEMEDDWQDEKTWTKPMPGLCGINEKGLPNTVDENGLATGYMTKIGKIREAADYAKEMPSAQNNFLTKMMNIWVGQATRWIPLPLWDENYTKEVYFE